MWLFAVPFGVPRTPRTVEVSTSTKLEPPYVVWRAVNANHLCASGAVSVADCPDSGTPFQEEVIAKDGVPQCLFYILYLREASAAKFSKGATEDLRNSARAGECKHHLKRCTFSKTVDVDC